MRRTTNKPGAPKQAEELSTEVVQLTMYPPVRTDCYRKRVRIESVHRYWRDLRTIAEGPTVLAFFPAAFTSGCTEEMCTFRDSMSMFDELDARVYGVSVDLPFSQNIWIWQEDLNFPMLSDWIHEVIHDYDVVLDDMYGMIGVAERSVFVVDTTGS